MQTYNDISGAVFPEREDISREFTDFETIHEGAFCRIIKAKRHGRWWILKGLAEKLGQSRMHLELLRKEFGIMNGMMHTGVVMVVGMEDVPGYGVCIIMEWVDGVTLREWLDADMPQSNRIGRPTSDCLPVAFQLIDVLEYVHRQQTAHRDLKPSNIMITRNGAHVKLIDFGFSDTDSSAVFKQPAGTYGYISPEQAVEHLTDIRNDIYSLGCIFEEMRFGRKYAGIVRRCKGPIESRFRTVAEIRRSFRRVTSVRRAVGLILIVLLALGIGFFMSDFRIKAMKSELEILSGKQMEIEYHTAEIEAAIAEGKRLMDEVMTETDPASFKSVSDVNAFIAAITPRLHAIWEAQPTSLGSTFTNSERESVRSALTTYFTALITPLNDRARELHEESMNLDPQRRKEARADSI